MRFAKGHGTGNDFVILPDPDGALALTPQLVRAVCDRRFGIGGDGVLRVVRTAKHPEAAAYVGTAEWFMDYHNADGSTAEMCGNGVRVFARYLRHTGLADTDQIPLATRAGLVMAVLAGDEITVDMVPPVLGPAATATVAGTAYPGTSCSVGNPHLVCPVPELSTMDLSAAPGLDPAAFPDGANVEFTVAGEPVPGADEHVHMRVYERGSAETLSCGSGACAVAAVALRDAGLAAGRVAVDVPGGRLSVALGPGTCLLTGPAVLVAHGEFER
ncbi:MAG TPA: diaminopimelate epimerase [Rugosimonospora sp.]|nr:diaminopimelate epimerase [Rugosimonospora sp.]